MNVRSSTSANDIATMTLNQETDLIEMEPMDVDFIEMEDVVLDDGYDDSSDIVQMLRRGDGTLSSVDAESW